MNILVTGGTGQLGSLLCKHYLTLEHNVIAMIRRTSTPTTWRWKELGIENNPNFSVCSGDLSDSASLDSIIKNHQPDWVINTAAQSFVKNSWESPIQTADITGIGPIRLFESIRHLGKENTKVVHLSSSEMIGGKNRIEEMDEQSAFDPQSIYGVAKVAAHHAASVYRQSYNMWISCAICFNFESKFRGLEFVTRKISDGVARIKFGLQDYIELGNLDSKRDWQSAHDVVNGIDLMLSQDIPDDYVFATGKTHSVRDFVEAALIAANLEPNIEKYVRQNSKYLRPADVNYLQGNYSKAKRVLGWEPKDSFKDLVKSMLDADLARVSNEVALGLINNEN